MKQTLNELKTLFNKPFINLDEMATLLGVPRRTLQQNIYTGRFEIPTFQINSKRMARLTDIADYIDEQCAQSAAEIKDLN